MINYSCQLLHKEGIKEIKACVLDGFNCGLSPRPSSIFTAGGTVHNEIQPMPTRWSDRSRTGIVDVS